MNVLVTGAYGRCGTAILDHLHDSDAYTFTYLDREAPPSEYSLAADETVVADVADYDAIEPAFEDQDAVVHLAAYARVESTWADVLEPNVVGTANVLEAARRAGVERVVFASTNHVVGMYEVDHAPAIYERDYDLLVDHRTPRRPDSFYGASKSFGEDLGRFYVEHFDSPRRFYALRICTVNDAPYDHPYGDAEEAVDAGEIDPGSDAYDEKVRRMKAMWHSRRDFAHQIDCCLSDDAVTFDVFYGLSDNRRRWFDLERSRAILGYDPRDDGEEWDAPPG